LALRYAREKRIVNGEQERQLAVAPSRFRIGSPPYLNTAPLIRGLEDKVIFDVPSELGRKLHLGELDAALLSASEVLLRDEYDVLDGMAIASLGEVKSVVLAHRRPLNDIREVYCDPASLCSVNMLRVLLAERGICAEFKPLHSYETATLPDEALLIGDRALDFALGPTQHRIWDLGAAWYEMTQLPFVHALWVLRRDQDTRDLVRILREARDFGMDTLDYLVESRTDYTRDFRRDYLTWYIHYHMGADEKRGMARFAELLRRHTPGPVYDPRFVA
jgi:chorismate dehydratase